MESNLNEAPVSKLGRGLLMGPCVNEALSIPRLVEEIREAEVGLDLILINDGSSDQTVRVAKRLKVKIIDLPCNLGVGQAVQVGFQYGVSHGYDFSVRIDGDGQHPPRGNTQNVKAGDGGGCRFDRGFSFWGRSDLD